MSARLARITPTLGRRLSTLAAALGLAAGLALAPVQNAGAQTPADFPPRPEVGDPKPFTLPPIERFTLDNGLRVTFAPYGLAPKTSISLVVDAGNLNDGEDTWLADLTGAMLKEGSNGATAEALARQAAAMGGGLDVRVGVHTTTISLDVLSAHAPDAAKLIGAVAMAPDFPADQLERVKQNLVRSVAVSKSEPGSIADAALANTVYGPDHPYGRTFPTDGAIEAYTLDDVSRFYSSEYGAARARLYVAGRFDADAMRAAVATAFSDWAPGAPVIDLPSDPQYGPRLIVTNRTDAPQTTLRLAFRAPDPGAPDDLSMRVMDALLGGAFTSRITSNIREDKGYTYSPGSYFDRSASDTMWVFSADVTTGDTGAALAEVFSEIRRLQTQTPTPEEAGGMRSWMSGVFILRNASASGLIGSLSTQDFHALPNDWLDAYVPGVLAVEDAALSQVATDYLPLDDMTLVIVGDLEEVLPQLRALPEVARLTATEFVME